MQRKNIIILFLFTTIILLATLLRFYKLGEAPAGLYLDEAAQGYNAYSILKTGRDEFGKPFPVVFRSFTDFKTPIYTYLIVPFIPIFELSVFTVRFPSFLFSILTIPFLYLLLRRITPQHYREKISIMVILLLAISPWHILFGRTSFECNVALFFLISGLYFFYKSLEKPRFLLLTSVLLAIAILAYHAQRIITPLIMLILFIRYNKTLLSNKHKGYFISGCVIGFLILIPTLSVATTPGFLARASLNIFSQQIQRPAGYIAGIVSIFNIFLNSSIFLSSIEFLSLYFSYFSPRSLFVLGDYDLRSSSPGLATFFLWQFPFYLIGLYLLIKNKKLGELRLLTLTLLLIAPIPAAVTRDPYSTIRALPMVIPLLIVISVGLIEVYDRITILRFRILSGAIFVVVLIFSVGKLYSSAIILNEHYRANSWNYGWQQAIETIEKSDKSFPVIVDNSRDEAYIQILFFLKYNPYSYQQHNFEVPLSQYYTNMTHNKEKYIGRITTRPINWEKDLKVEEYLIGDELSISTQQISQHQLTLIKEINYPDGSVSLRIVKTNPI